MSASEMSQSNWLSRSSLEAKFKLTNPNCRFARDVKAAIMMLGIKTKAFLSSGN